MENKIFWKSISVDRVLWLWLKNWFTFLFSLQTISGLIKAQRERQRQRERRKKLAHSHNHIDPPRKFLSSLILITHAKPKPKDEESYRQWSPDPVPDPRLRWFDRAASNPSPMNPVWSCSPSPPPCDLASRSNPVASAARPRLNPVASLSSFFSQFDRIWWIFFLGFVSFVFL